MIAGTFWENTRLAAHSGKKQDWQHILEKIYNWQDILWENMIDSTF
jgi:hypothetical protein